MRKLLLFLTSILIWSHLSGAQHHHDDRSSSSSSSSAADKLQYENAKVLRLTLRLPDHVNQLLKAEDWFDLDFWDIPTTVDDIYLLVPDHDYGAFMNFLQKTSIPWKIEEKNVLRHLQQDDLENMKVKHLEMLHYRKTHDVLRTPKQHYADLNEIYDWIYRLSRLQPHLVTVQDIGHTYENRSTLLLQISNNKEKPIIFVEAGIHAREWLATSSAIYFVDHLVQQGLRGKSQSKANMNNPSEISDLLDHFQFHVLIVANPDGYQFTHEHKHDYVARFWRKNRRDLRPNCKGVDLNRNFDIRFGEVGIDKFCHQERYPGTEAFSEVETRNIRDYILRLGRRVVAYVSLHAYGQHLLLPFAFSESKKSVQYSHLKAISQDASNVIRHRNEHIFQSGTLYEWLQSLASGSSTDWAEQVAGIQYSFAVELQPESGKGAAGFDPSTSRIPSSGEEVIIIVNSLARHLLSNREMRN